MAAMMRRTEIEVKRTTVPATIPNDPIGKLMYYINCVCTCVKADNDPQIRRLRDYGNYTRLSDEEKGSLLGLCLALSPDKLMGAIFFPCEDLPNFDNEFFELNAVRTRLVVTEALMIGGQEKKIHKIMMFKKCWVEKNYLGPLKKIVEQNQRQIRPPPRRNDSCIIL